MLLREGLYETFERNLSPALMRRASHQSIFDDPPAVFFQVQWGVAAGQIRATTLHEKEIRRRRLQEYPELQGYAAFLEWHRPLPSSGDLQVQEGFLPEVL